MRRWAARLALLALGLSAGVALGELVARLVRPSGAADLLFNAPTATPPGLYVTDRELIMVPVPGFEGPISSAGYGVDLRIDSLGLRGPEPGPGERWLVLGDSFALSAQVEEDETFHAHLARSAGVQVLNAGVDGYSTWQALGRYRRLAPAVDATRVILVFFLGNDFTDNVLHRMRLQNMGRVPDGSPIPQEAVSPLTRFLLGHSAVYAQVRVWQRARAVASGADPRTLQWRQELSLFTDSGAGELSRATTETRHALEALAREARGRDQGLWVAVAPAAFQVDRARVPATFRMVGLDPADAALDAPTRALGEILRDLDVAACDLVEPLRAATGREPLYFTYDGHWTPSGHQVVGEALAKCLQ